MSIIFYKGAGGKRRWAEKLESHLTIFLGDFEKEGRTGEGLFY
jgi:hypothetical protein